MFSNLQLFILSSRPTHKALQTKRFITTWSSLATALNSKPVKKTNYSLSKPDTGLFKIPQLVDSSGFYLLNERVVARTEYLLAETNSKKRNRKMVEVFDDLSDALCRVADMAEFIRIAHPRSEYCSAAEYACTHISALVEKLNTNRDLYNVLKRVAEEGDRFAMDDVDKHVAKLFLFDFEQSGIHLNEDKRNRVVSLNEEILRLGSFFVQNCNASRAVAKSKLPTDLQNIFTSSGDSILVNSLHAESNDERVREAAYKIYLYPNDHQEEILTKLLSARRELAQLCGFPTYAHRALRNSLAGDPDVVISFLEQMNEIIKESSAANFLEMSQMKRKSSVLTSFFNQELKPWDVPYYTAVYKNEKFRIHVPEYMPYFSLGGCMEGLNYILHSLYGITLINQQPEPGELWTPEIYKLAVHHDTEYLLGYIYCDFYERRGKPNQDCHFTIQGGRQISDGSYQLPVVVLLLNFPEPTSKAPSLLTPGMMENLFHEMGHAMHSMLGRTKYQHVTGTRCSTDFAEVPSILMEYFANDPKVLSKFCRHYKTGEEMPKEMLTRLCHSKHVFNASETQLQVLYSVVDQIYHIKPLENQTSTQVVEDMQKKFYGLPYEPNTAWQLRFSHLIGYGAKYYSYLMARAVASLIWQQCFQKDPFNSIIGEKYRQDILAHGGGKPPKEMIEAFLGKEATPPLLTQALKAEITRKGSS